MGRLSGLVRISQKCSIATALSNFRIDPVRLLEPLRKRAQT
jgi:hypothetical protein